MGITPTLFVLDLFAEKLQKIKGVGAPLHNLVN